MSWIKLAFDNFLNDSKSSDGRLVILTQITLILFLATLSLTSASVQQYLDGNLNNMLGADVSVSGPRPLSNSDDQLLSQKASGIARIQLLPLAISLRGKTIPVQLKVIGDRYPLQGSLKIGTAENRSIQKTIEHGPPSGEIWLGPRASSKIGANIGDRIAIGEDMFRFSAIIYHEPDRLMEGHSVSMRAMINSNSLAIEDFKSSKMRYRYLLTATPDQQADVENWAAETLSDFTLLTKAGGGHPLALFWQRTENFLGLASVILFFLAAIAIDMANRRYLERQKQRLAVYLSFGQTLASCLRLSLLQWLFGFLLSFVIAVSLSYIAQYFLIGQLIDQFPGITSGWHLAIIAKTTGLIFLLLLAFQIPMLWQLSRTSLVGLIRAVEYPSAQLLRIFWGFASISLLAAYYSDNFLLTGLTLGALGAALLLMAILSWIILTAGEFWGRRYPGLLSFNFFIMKQRMLSKSSQILGLGLCSLLLLFTLMLMKDIGDTMKGYTRANDGNLMVAELQEKDKPALENWSRKNQSEIRQLRPYAAAKLSEINGQPIDAAISTPSETLATVKNSIRLHWSNTIPSNNKLVGGKWWSEKESNWNQISAEEEVMTDLGLNYGDQLTFVIGGKATIFELVASHAFKPGRGSVTFWFQIPERAMDVIKPDVFYMGSIELPEAAWSELGSLWRNYPSLSLVPLKELTQRFDDLLAIVTKLVVGYAAMVLIMTALVIAASMKGFEAEDRQKNGLLMSMGVTKKACVKLALYDWLTVSLIAAIGAIAGTWLAGFLIYQSQFSMIYEPDPIWLVSTMLAIGVTVCGIGVIYSRNSLSTSINNLLHD
ncbi:ABC transporter permease [Parasphingorhabdus sp.]|jgi:predicted lysophospholipase L1 biosynthesis ABC-type transport system permease subunit|uniref:ABC transporter permease n=1 Tax=Parasphingorhabdus sp. TaxID=2709688 RepID=UPI003D2D2940